MHGHARRRWIPSAWFVSGALGKATGMDEIAHKRPLTVTQAAELLKAEIGRLLRRYRTASAPAWRTSQARDTTTNGVTDEGLDLAWEA